MIVDQFSDWIRFGSDRDRLLLRHPDEWYREHKEYRDNRVVEFCELDGGRRDAVDQSLSSGEMRSRDIKVVKTTTGLQLY